MSNALPRTEEDINLCLTCPLPDCTPKSWDCPLTIAKYGYKSDRLKERIEKKRQYDREYHRKLRAKKL